MNASAVIFGASGYSGLELTALLSRHPHVRLRALGSDRWAGASVSAKTGLSGLEGLTYTSFEDVPRAEKAVDVAFLATPAEVSLKLAPELLASGVRVIDLSGAFRLADRDVFERAYGHPAASPALLSQAVYGLPELGREALRSARLVANPGCYPTAAALALAPLLRARVVDPSDVVVDAMSGVSGAGRKSGEEFAFVELSANARAYRVLSHQHTPEIAQTLNRSLKEGGASDLVDLTFTPHLIPVARGILCTSYARTARSTDAEELTAILRDAYRGERFVHVLDRPDEVSLNRVVGTNDCALGVAVEPKSRGRVVVVSAIDNLIKGAAGQAVQNLNAMFGWDDASGLLHSWRHTP